MKPAAREVWLFATVMAVLWAILLVAIRTLLLLAFGRGGPNRFYHILVLGGVLVAIFCAHSFRSGWKQSHAAEPRR
jgi:hypothetical protein